MTIKIDGAFGEGGGQVLRTSLTMSMLTGQAFKISRIRAKRRKPGLLRQHLTCVKAAQVISDAKVTGAEVNSQEIVFTPGKIKSGNFDFTVGTAGSVNLVLQTVLPVLLTAEGESEVRIRGGTHNPMAPPYHFLKDAFIPILHKMGAKVKTELVTPGFYPAGGGEELIKISPLAELQLVDLVEPRGETEVSVTGMVSMLPYDIAVGEIEVVADMLSLTDDKCRLENLEGHCAANIVYVTAKSDQATEVVTSFGALGISRKKVAVTAAREMRKYLASNAVVGEHLADQLFFPLVMAAGGSYLTTEPSMHTVTNVEIIKKFIDVDIKTEQVDDNTWKISVNRN